MLLQSLYDKFNNHTKQIAILKKVSKAYNKLKLFKHALNTHLQILALCELENNKLEQAYALNEIGYIYKCLEDYNKSLVYFLNFLILCKELRMDNYHFQQYSEALLTIGEIYQNLGEKGERVNYNHALNSYDKKLQVSLRA